MDETALVVAEPVDSVLPAFSGRQMGQALTAYKDLQRALDDGMPECIMEIQGRKFRKKSYWRAVATAFKLNVECISERREQTNGAFVYIATYRATTPSGRSADGDGACSSAEKSAKQATEHNVRSHAHTRAFNRAVSNMVGFGEVSAEEIEYDGVGEVVSHVPPPAQAQAPAPAAKKAPATKAAGAGAQILHVKDARQATGKSGSPYYQIYFRETLGGSDKDMATSFDEEIVKKAMFAMEKRRAVQATFSQSTQGYWNLKTLEVLDEESF